MCIKALPRFGECRPLQNTPSAARRRNAWGQRQASQCGTKTRCLRKSGARRFPTFHRALRLRLQRRGYALALLSAQQLRQFEGVDCHPPAEPLKQLQAASVTQLLGQFLTPCFPSSELLLYADDVTQTVRGPVGNILHLLAGIAAAFTKLSDIFSRAPPPVSEVAAESRAESAAEGAGAATTTEITTATPTATSAVARDAKIVQDGQVTDVTSISPDQQEIQRRRELVRALFNDFWSGRDDKPATFADRLDQAEIYLNDRLTACGEYWQLDAKTRKLLGLPARRSTSSARASSINPEVDTDG